MSPGEEKLSRAKPPEDGLESYRRLIELQKQMIELIQKHEQAKRDCAALREQVTREMSARVRARRTWRQRLQQKGGQWLRRLPGFSALMPPTTTLNQNQTSSC